MIIEKDFWVCWLLGRIFAEPKLADACVFKGGTSLSKVFNAIARFSEDIDLAILPESLGWNEEDLDQAPSRTKREERVTELEAACAVAVQQTWQPVLERAIQAALGSPPESGDWLAYQFEEESRSPVLIFAYPGALPRAVEYIARQVKIEFGSLTDQRPNGRHPIQALAVRSDSRGLPLQDYFGEKRVAVVLIDNRYLGSRVHGVDENVTRPGERPLPPVQDRLWRHYSTQERSAPIPCSLGGQTWRLSARRFKTGKPKTASWFPQVCRA